MVVGMLVPVGREWLAHQPASVGQSVFFVQYAAKPLATVADLVVVQVERQMEAVQEVVESECWV